MQLMVIYTFIYSTFTELCLECDLCLGPLDLATHPLYNLFMTTV